MLTKETSSLKTDLVSTPTALIEKHFDTLKDPKAEHSIVSIAKNSRASSRSEKTS